MLNIKEKQCVNFTKVTGVLSELSINKGEKIKDGKPSKWASAKLSIKVDQEISGIDFSGTYVVSMIANELTAKNTENQIYKTILSLPEKYIPLNSCQEGEEDKASMITVTGQLKENVFGEKKRLGYQIDGKFINPKKDKENEEAIFDVTGVIGRMAREVDKEGTETGRLCIDIVNVGYGGRVQVFPLIVEEESKVDYIEANFNQWDTASFNGPIKQTYEENWVEEPNGFGKPKRKLVTKTVRELIVDGGSESGFDTDSSYDKNDIMAAMAERKAYYEEKEKNNAKKAATAPSNATGF